MSQEKEYVQATILSPSLQSLVLGWGMILAYVLLNSLGAVILKGRVQKIGSWHFIDTRSYFHYFVALFSYWQTWFGFISVGASSAAWLVALNKLELSRAHPIAIGFNLILVFSISLLNYHEPFTYSKAIGIFLILTGIVTLYHN